MDDQTPLSGKAPLRTKLAIAAVTVAFGLVAGQMYLKSHGGHSRKIPNSGKGHVVVNEHGYIGQSFPPERSPNTYRILGLGDSVTMYYGAEKKNYLSAMSEEFEKAGTQPKVEVLNFGVAGYDTPAEVRRLEVKGLAYKPDLVVVGYVLNDAIAFPFVISSVFGKPIASEEEGESPGVLDFVQSAMAAAQSKKQDFFDKVWSSDLWKGSVMALNQLDQLSKANGFKVVVVVFPMFIKFDPYQLQPVHDAIRVQALRHNFGFLDLALTFGALGDVKAYADARGKDTIHPNVKGHKVAGDALFAYLNGAGYLPTKAPPAPGPK
jgi:lysophospholipase L1-like esterase